MSSDFMTAIEWRVLAAFMNAAVRVPAYAKFLRERGVEPGKIRSLADFATAVPPADKKTTFVDNDIADLCLDGDPGDPSAAYTSSGYSKEFSFGLETSEDAEGLRKKVDRMLKHHFAAHQRRTMVINALPMGVRVPAGNSLVIDTGTRADAVVAAVRKLGPLYEQIVIVGEHPFLKRALEEGQDEKGFDWKNWVVHLVTGAEVMPENFRTYAGGILGHDPARPDRGVIVVSFGISELGLSIGQETGFCRAVRREALRNPALRQAMFGSTPFLPTFVQWNPLDYWLETKADEHGRERLHVTTLDLDRRIPLIRYGTGDWAEVMWPYEVARRMRASGVDLPVPEFPLPFVSVWGRGRGVHKLNGPFPEEVKEAIYANPEVAELTYGCFTISVRPDGVQCVLELKQDKQGSAELVAERLSKQLVWLADVTLIEGREPSYQRKFQYLEPESPHGLDADTVRATAIGE